MIEQYRRRLYRFDWLGGCIILLLSLFGLLFVFSTTYQPSSPCSLFFKKQLFGLITGFFIFGVMLFIDYRRLQRWGYFLYIATLLLLVFTLFKGSIGLGAQRWINLGFIKFQPSELIKLFFPAFFTFSLTSEQVYESRVTSFVPMLLIILVSFLLIAKQPDLGTAIIIALSSLVLLAYAQIGRAFFICLFAFCFISAPLLWKFLKPYQKQRISVFLGYGNVKKERYQIEQSCIAIGSGGLTGKGFLKGTQNLLQFLPESRTDFIFSILCEEWGFIGALVIILLYLLLFLRYLLMIFSFSQYTAQMLALGLLMPTIISTLINMGMVTGLLPIVGIPLPLMSYGITHSWISLASLGWFNNILISQGKR